MNSLEFILRPLLSTGPFSLIFVTSLNNKMPHRLALSMIQMLSLTVHRNFPYHIFSRFALLLLTFNSSSTVIIDI